MTAPSLAAEAPPGAPRHWDRMPWHARRQWLAARRRQAATQPPTVEQDAPPAATKLEEDAPAVDPSLPDGAIGVDASGRWIWTMEAMRAADAARHRASRGKGPALTLLQRDAMAALRRTQEAARRAGLAAAERPPRSETLTLRTVLAMQGRDVADVCEAIGRAPSTIAQHLRNAGRTDLAPPFEAAAHIRRRRQR